MKQYLDMPGLTHFYNEIKDRFATKSSVGTPLRASSKSQMTDKEKVYIYTGSESGYTKGHWYYYEDNKWKDGGVYNSVAVATDKKLMTSDVAADAKVVGDKFTAVDEEFANIIEITKAEVDFMWGLSEEEENAENQLYKAVPLSDAEVVSIWKSE